jgi:hypothetical protein
MGWRALIVAALAGAGISLAACGGRGPADPDAQWYRNGYNFGVGIDQHGSPNVQADSPTQFCNAALEAVHPGGGSNATYPTSDGTNVPLNAPPLSDSAADNFWVTGCAAGLTSE